jgi:sugar/nucleoside kinase (ribokinase family)
MADVLCLGEIIVDWVSTALGAELQDATDFKKAPGGAPANTAVGLARQGVSTGFIGRVAGDQFGLWLKSILEKDGVDTSSTVVDHDAQTRMAYVITTAKGDRKLAEFSKIACADAQLKPEDLIPETFKSARIFHFGSISMISETADLATQRALELAAQNNLLISFDPNVRLALWPKAELCKEKILHTLSKANIVKINEEELLFLTGSKEPDQADALQKKYKIPLLIVTLDSRGAHYFSQVGNGFVSGFKVNLVEATGAGDGFNAGILSGLLENLGKVGQKILFENLTTDLLNTLVERANAIGALTCTKAGAIPALPTRKEVDDFLKRATASI